MMIPVPVLLAAGCQSVGSDYREADNRDLATLGNCRALEHEAALTEIRLRRVKSIKSDSQGRNVLTGGAALLRLDPLLLLNIKRSERANEIIKSYEERLVMLKSLQQEHCTGEQTDNAVASAGTDTLPLSGSPAPAEDSNHQEIRLTE